MTFTIHTGDALFILKRLAEESVDAVITDPPYSSGGMFRGDRSRDTGDKYVGTDVQRDRVDFPGDSRDQRSFGYWCTLWLAEAWRVAKPGAMLCVFTDWRQLPTMTDVVQAGGWVWKGIVPWNKTEAARPQKGWFRAQCEYVIVAAKGVPATLEHKAEASYPSMPGFFCCPVDRDNMHQTQKPVDVMRWLAQLVPRGGGNPRPLLWQRDHRRRGDDGGPPVHRLRAHRALYSHRTPADCRGRPRRRAGQPLRGSW